MSRVSTGNYQVSEALYLPKIQFVKAVSFGYNRAVSHLLWFKTLNYFGKHFDSDKDYRYFPQMCDIVTSLDEYSLEKVEFCSLMLAWELNDAQKAVSLLNRSIKLHKNNWRLYYLRAAFYAFLLNENDKAKENLELAIKIPNSPQFIKELANKISDDNKSLTLQFLRNSIRNSKNRYERAVLLQRYQALLKEQNGK